jgi:hypothetical protein
MVAWWAGFENTIARLNSPAFTGTPSAPSPSAADASNRLATTEWSGNASNLTLGTIPIGRIPTLNQNTTGNAATATRLATGRTISISGGATASAVTFDGTANIALAVTSLDATLLTGAIADARMSANIPRLNTTPIYTLGLQVQGAITNLGSLTANTQAASFTSGATGNAYQALINANAPIGGKVIDWELNFNGTLSLRRVNDTYSGIVNTPLTVSPTGNLSFSGFTSLGHAGVKIQTFDITTPTVSTNVAMLTGQLPAALKILSITGSVVSSDSEAFAPGFYSATMLYTKWYSIYSWSTNLYINLHPDALAKMGGRPGIITVIYKA